MKHLLPIMIAAIFAHRGGHISQVTYTEPVAEKHIVFFNPTGEIEHVVEFTRGPGTFTVLADGTVTQHGGLQCGGVEVGE